MRHSMAELIGSRHTICSYSVTVEENVHRRLACAHSRHDTPVTKCGVCYWTASHLVTIQDGAFIINRAQLIRHVASALPPLLGQDLGLGHAAHVDGVCRVQLVSLQWRTRLVIRTKDWSPTSS